MREHDRVAPLVRGKVRREPQTMPKFLGDERKEWMEQADHVRKNEINHRQGVRLSRAVRTLERGLARFQVPIAKLTPKEAIEGLSDFIEAVGRKRIVDLANGPIQL